MILIIMQVQKLYFNILGIFTDLTVEQILFIL